MAEVFPENLVFFFPFQSIIPSSCGAPGNAAGFDYGAMALLSPRMQQSPLYGSGCCSCNYSHNGGNRVRRESRRWCSAIAVDATSALTSVSGIQWGSSKLQGRRSEMEDDVVIRSDGLGGFAFAAVFDGHAGLSSVEFLRDELYKECVTALQGGSLLGGKNYNAIRDALCEAFQTVDAKLLSRLDDSGSEDDSGSTATVIFVRNDVMIISHVGDSCVAISRSGKADVSTNPHRPYGNKKVSLEEVKRIRAAGGWIADGRICGDISVSRAFGDLRFKTKKNEMLEKGVKEGRWTQKFISRVQFNGDLVTSVPDIYQVDLGDDVEFILLASDGLWDYMKSRDAVAFVRNQLREHSDVQQACEALARAALDRGSEDNISVVIADLGRTDWPNLPVQGPNFFIEISQVFATVGIVSLGIWVSSLLSL
uniref:protein-serine/threonine phosphatase n=1 Tax=Anthurium amnicola TaxID=1678845 RepID=A0A1D1YVH7_9ARAE